MRWYHAALCPEGQSQRDAQLCIPDAQRHAAQHPSQIQAAAAARAQLCGRKIPQQKGQQCPGQCCRQYRQREPAQPCFQHHEAQHGRKGRAAHGAVGSVGGTGTFCQRHQHKSPQHRGCAAQLHIARTGQLQAGGQAAVHCQQHQHRCRSGGFQCKAGQTPQAKLCAAAQAGGVIRQPDGPESLCTEQRDQQPGHQLALAAQQRGLCDAGRRPAHTYGSQCAHHQAQAAQRGHPALHRGLRLLLFLRPEAFQLLQQRCHKIAERRRQHKAQC